MKKFISTRVKVYHLFLRTVVVVGKLFVLCLISSAETRAAKKRAEDRAEDEYANSGYDPIYMPIGTQPTQKDFDAVRKNSWF